MRSPVSVQLKRIARALGLSDAEVARRAGLSERRYGHYVTGRNEPDLATLLRLCKTLNVSPNDLLGYEVQAETRSRGSKRKKSDGDRETTRVVAAMSVLPATDQEVVREVADALVRRATPGEPARKG